MAKKRLFFALWPEDAVRAQLVGLQTLLPQAQGRWLHAQDLHLTLQFLGAVQVGQMSCIRQAADAVSVSRFELCIDHLDYWPKPGIAWAGVKQTPAALTHLHAQLGRGLHNCGFKPEKRCYRPHVTLVRNTTPSGRLAVPEPVLWPVDHFVLVESQPFGDPPWYHPIDGWALEK